MTARQHDPLNSAMPDRVIAPDTNDPTAGRVAISRELASEQVRLIADPATPTGRWP